MRRFWPLLLFIVILIVILLRPSSQQATSDNNQPTDYQRIISLSPSITETVFALGLEDKIVGVTDYCDYPPQAQALPKVGGYTDTSLEAVVALQPDLVITLKAQQRLRQQLAHLGIATHQIDNSNLVGIQAGIASIGQLTDSSLQADRLLDDINQLIQHVQQKVANVAAVPTLISIAHYVNSDQLETVYVAGQKDFYNDLLKLAGGRNVYNSSQVMVPSVTAEGIIRMNPEVIFDVFPEADDHHSDMQQVRRQWQALDAVNAVQTGRVHIIERDYASIPGPRVFRLLPEFAQLLHPELDWEDLNHDD